MILEQSVVSGLAMDIFAILLVPVWNEAAEEGGIPKK
jgi:hypothetical protein